MQSIRMLFKKVRSFGIISDATKHFAAFRLDKRATSAIEFSFIAGLLSLGLMNVVDISTYVYQRMQVENAAQMGAQAAYTACNLTSLPATTNCSGLTAAVTNAVQSTSMGKQVALVSGFPTEGYYCVNSSNQLEYVGSVGSPEPTDCTGAGTPSLMPGDYIQIETTYTYQPMFTGMSVADFLTGPITATAWMRLD